MAVSKKNKNRAVVDGKEYLWWVFDEYDQTAFDGIQIKVICSDQTHFLKYGLQQRDTNRMVILSLRDYAKMVQLSSPPKFENEAGIITKSGISRLIKWCKKEGHQIEYALDKGNNQLTKEERQAVFKEIQEILN